MSARKKCWRDHRNPSTPMDISLQNNFLKELMGVEFLNLLKHNMMKQ